MNAQELTAALAGRWHGSYGSCRCPAHQDRTPSLTIREGDRAPLVRCHAGCERVAIIDALKRQGLWPGRAERRDYVPPRRKPDDDTQARIAAARAIWAAATPAEGTLVEDYLHSRGITTPAPSTIRYAPGLRHSATGLSLPAMICAVQGADRRITAIHRTFLRLDGHGKAPVSNCKMALGSLGDGAVRLAAAGPVIGICEGVESGLSAAQLFNLPTWCALGSRLDRIALPPEVVEVHIFADADVPGREAAACAAEVFNAQGRRVFLRFPPEPFGDFNDMLCAEAAA